MTQNVTDIDDHRMQILLEKHLTLTMESGWYSGKKLDFHPTNPGLTPARVNYHKKRSKPPSVP